MLLSTEKAIPIWAGTLALIGCFFAVRGMLKWRKQRNNEPENHKRQR